MVARLLYEEDEGDIRIVVPAALQIQIIRSVHEYGHFSATKTEATVHQEYWIPELRVKVTEKQRVS